MRFASIAWVVFAVLALSASAHTETITLNPLAECQWIFFGRVDNPHATCPSLDARQGSRAALLFDLSEVDRSRIISLTLELVVVEGLFIGSIEAMGFAEPLGTPLDPFIYTTLNPEAGPCSESSTCPVLLVEKSDSSTQYSFGYDNTFPRHPSDVTSATAAISTEDNILQLSLIPGQATLLSGAQFGHSGFVDGRLAPATLLVELPEPGLPALLLIGLIVTAAARGRGALSRRLNSSGLLILGLAIAIPSRADATIVVINNGLAPPNPANVVDAANSFPSDELWIQNAGCDATVQHPCSGPGEPTTVEMVDGGQIGKPVDSPSGAGPLEVFQSSTFIMSGGFIRSNAAANESSTILMSGGFIAEDIRTGHSSVAVMSGGSIDNIYASGQSEVRLSGGLLRQGPGDNGLLVAQDLSTIEIVGADFRVDGVSVPFGPISKATGRLTGILLEGDTLNNDFIITNTSALIILVPDNCPNDDHADQTDSDGNGVGDACNDSEDLDGDEWADSLDNCPNDFDPSQADQDDDGLGDLCDPFPNDPDNNLAQCSSDLGDCQIDLLSCESDAVQCSTDLSLAQTSVTVCNDDLSSCIGTATQLEADLAQTETDLSQAQSDVTLLRADVTQLESDLASTEADLAAATADTDEDGIRDTADACPGTIADAEVDLLGCSHAQFCSEIDASTGPGGATCNNSDWQNDEARAQNPDDCKAKQGVCVPLG